MDRGENELCWDGVSECSKGGVFGKYQDKYERNNLLD
jgi:hypothetical protein